MQRRLETYVRLSIAMVLLLLWRSSTGFSSDVPMESATASEDVFVFSSVFMKLSPSTTAFGDVSGFSSSVFIEPSPTAFADVSMFTTIAPMEPSPVPTASSAPCLSSPCRNGGLCTNQGDSYQCTCSAGFTGLDCESEIDMPEPATCVPNPCQNNANCSLMEDRAPGNREGREGPDSNLQVVCTCQLGYTGRLCETDVDECAGDPCGPNSVSCSDGVNDFKCDCEQGFTGQMCEQATCDFNPCQNGGSCLLDNTGRVCMCLPTFTGTLCDTVTRLLPYGQLYGDSLVPNFDDGVSDEIPIPRGFRFFDRTHYKAYICTNGLISLTKPFYDYYARLFPAYSEYDWLYDRSVIAPFWADVDIRSDGQISYHVYEPGSSANTIIEAVNLAVRDFFASEFSDFSATWVLVATWHRVPNYPYGSRYYSRSVNEQAGKRNTFQAVLATGGQHSFAMYLYDEEGLEWADRSTKGVIGYSAAGGNNFFNHPLSQTDDILKIGSSRSASNIGATGHLLYLVSLPPTFFQLAEERCLQWYDRDRHFLGSEIRSLQSVDPCPCQWWQAWFDDMFVFYWNTFCAVSVFPSGSHGQECCYSSHRETFGALLTGAPDGGSVDLYHASVDEERHNSLDVTPYYDCCTISGHCDLYYERRPSDTCSRYEPPFRGWFWGDPHMMTMDGKKYTFNGWGEYILMKTVNDTFILEGRTEPAVNSTATIFSAFAMVEFDGSNDFARRMPRSSIIHVELKGDKMVVKACCSGNLSRSAPESWTDYTTEYEALNNVSSIALTNVQIRRPDNETVLAAFTSRISVSVKLQKSLLAVLFSAPPRYQGATGGLLGRWDQNVSNDFVARNGTEISINATDRQIHDVSQTWQILSQESLFYYHEGMNLSTYAHPDHQPVFLDELLQGNIDPQIITACGGDSSCIFDTVETGDMEIGMQSRSTSNTFDDQLANLRNNPPVISGDTVLYVSQSKQSIYTLSVSDPNDTFTVTLQGNPPPQSDYSFDRTDNIITFTWTPRTTDSVQLMFVANDSQGAASVLHPLVRLCACAMNAECVNSTGDGGMDRFLLQDCVCGTGWEGRLCFMDVDGCETVSCPEGSDCQDNPAPQEGATCGDCPMGTELVEGKCADIDECNSTTHGCVHKCVNQHSNYTCECNSGYELLSDGQSCQDINECELNIPPCHHLCENSNGSYSCECNPGYRLAVDNSTCLPYVNCTRTDCEQLCAVVNNTEICGCQPGYRLMNSTLCKDIDECDTKIDNCDQNCFNTPGSFTCSCRSGYSLRADGHSCEDTNECVESFPATPCTVTGQTCTNTEGGFNCSCAIGQEVLNGQCAVINRCASQPCINGGTCRRNLPGQFVCDCRAGFIGTLCETDINECESSPCLYGGTCIDGVGRFTCQCPDGLGGARCGRDLIDECNSSPCVNGGTCFNEIFNFSCGCVPGTAGRQCETDTMDECMSFPCRNSGRCTDRPGGFQCQCSSGLTGSQCEAEIDECSSHPCLNNGICRDQIGVYRCDCLSAYTGDQCESEVNECLSDPCQNGGICEDLFDKYECDCLPGYDGVLCENDTDECSTTQHGCEQQCIDQVNSVRCACDEGYALNVDRKTCRFVPCGMEQTDCNEFAACVEREFDCGSESYIKSFFDAFCSLKQTVPLAAGLWIENVTDCLSTELRSFWEESYLFGVSDPVLSDCRTLSQRMRDAQETCFDKLLCDTPFTPGDSSLIVNNAFKQSETSRAQLLRLLEACPTDTAASLGAAVRDEGFILCFSLPAGLGGDELSATISQVEREYSAVRTDGAECPSQSDGNSRRRRSLDLDIETFGRYRRNTPTDNTTGSPTAAATASPVAAAPTPTTSSGGGLGFSSNSTDQGSACKNGSGDVGNATLSCPVCGDGIVEVPDEGCDDGNTMDGDGCSANCTDETGFDCDSPPNMRSVCYNVTCGDGIRVAGEDCDTGGLAGCSDCTIDDGFNCTTPSFAISTCVAICGDGKVLGDETCDDGNMDSLDGCSNACAVEVGYNCSKSHSNGTSICELLPNFDCIDGQCSQCGNGVLELPEECDDDMQSSGMSGGGIDGCNDTCAVDELFECTNEVGELSVCQHVSVDFDKTDDTTLDYATVYTEAKEPVFLADPDLLDASSFGDTDWKEVVVTLTNARDSSDEEINFEPGSAASSGRITSSDKLILDDRILRGGSLTLTPVSGKPAVSLRLVLLVIAYEHQAATLPQDRFARSITVVVTDKNDIVAPTVQVNVTFVGQDLNAPIVRITDNVTEFVEGAADPISITNGSLTVTDVDNDFHQMESGSISLKQCPDCDAEELTLESTGAITVINDSTMGMLSLNGSASEAAYQSLMNRVTYINRASEPTRPFTRTVVFTVSDGAKSGSAEATITIINVNDRPVVTFDGASSSTVDFTEGGSAVAIATTVNITDEDPDQVIGATVTISHGQTGDELQLTGSFAGITTTFESNNQTVVLRGSLSAREYERALVAVMFYNPNADPGNVEAFTRNITIIVNDSTSASQAVYAYVNVTAVNDRPIFHFGSNENSYGSVSDRSRSVIFTEDGDGTNVFPITTTLRDVDSSQLSSASLMLSGILNGMSETINFNQTLASLYGITITNVWNNDSTQLNVSLTGNSAVSNYRELLLSAAYSNSRGDGMQPGHRTILATAKDTDDASSDSVNVTVTVDERNDPPEINLGVGFGQPDAISFTEADTAYTSIVTFGFRFALRDEDSTMISKATISLRTSPVGYLDMDEYLFRITKISDDITFVSSGDTITLTGIASFSDYADAIGSLKYQSLADEPTLYVGETFTPVERFIDVKVWDNGLISSFTGISFPAIATTATVTLTIELINDNTPVITLVTVPESCSADPNSNSRRKRYVENELYENNKLVPRKMNKPKAPPIVVSVSGFGPTRDALGSSSVVTVKFRNNTNQAEVSRPKDINQLLSFSPSPVSNLTYMGYWHDSRTLVIVFPKVSDDQSALITFDNIQITFKEPEGRCDQYDVCKRHICHEDGMSCSVTGSYSLFGSLDAASVQPTDLKSDWILMAIAFLLIVFVSVAVFARRHQKRRSFGPIVTDERGLKSPDVKVQRKLPYAKVQKEEIPSKGIHKQADSQVVEALAAVQSRHEVVEMGESEPTLISNETASAEQQTRNSEEQTTGKKLPHTVIRPDTVADRDLKQCQGSD